MWHAIATRTVTPTLKSAREYNERPRAPEIMFSGDDPEVVWRQLVMKIGAVMGYTNGPELCLNGLPIYVTSDWTYWLVGDAK